MELVVGRGPGNDEGANHLERVDPDLPVVGALGERLPDLCDLVGEGTGRENVDPLDIFEGLDEAVLVHGTSACEKVALRKISYDSHDDGDCRNLRKTGVRQVPSSVETKIRK